MRPPVPTVETLITGVSSRTALREARLSNNPHDVRSQRSEAGRDADRILYSSSWRRLAGVTQVVTPFEGQATLHNRLTHSEKVGQVARAIALNILGAAGKEEQKRLSDLGGYSSDVCQAAGLAHDIGHAPFGHIGEEILDEVAREELNLSDGFEGNAQTVRILTTRRVRKSVYEGLDLTKATLAAVLKYPWVRADKVAVDHDGKIKSDASYRRHWNKFNVYNEQKEIIKITREFLPEGFGNQTQTLEASTMDVADDITYAIHDLEDFYIAGALNTARIAQDLSAMIDPARAVDKENPFAKLWVRLKLDYPAAWLSQDSFDEALKTALSLFSVRFGGRAQPTSAEDESSARATLSDEISRLIEAVEVRDKVWWDGGPYLGLRRLEWHQVQVFKHITRSYVISHPDVALLQVGQQTILRELIDMLRKWAERDAARLPRVLREELTIAQKLQEKPELRGYGHERFADRGSKERSYLDFLCMLTDAQCISLHEKLSGRRLQTIVNSGF